MAPSENRDVGGLLRDIRAAGAAFADEIEVLTGIEIGEPHVDPAATSSCAHMSWIW